MNFIHKHHAYQVHENIVEADKRELYRRHVQMLCGTNLNATMKGECSDFVLYTKKAPSLWSRLSSCSACDNDLTPL